MSIDSLYFSKFPLRCPRKLHKLLQGLVCIELCSKSGKNINTPEGETEKGREGDCGAGKTQIGILLKFHIVSTNTNELENGVKVKQKVKMSKQQVQWWSTPCTQGSKA